jgi:5'-nucleotidase (lipoprotein e(P4) family)
MIKRALLASLAVGLTLVFTSGPVRADEPPNLDLAKQQMRNYVGSGEYAKRVAEVALQANRYLVKRIAKGAKPGKKLAVVFDIDETTLSNLPHLIANDYGYVPKTWDAWVLSGQAHAIIPVQTVYDTAVRGKVDVFFITTRPESARASTERNLREVGYDTWARIFYKPVTGPEHSTTGFKTDVRRKLVKEGYVIILNLGDQDSDVMGGYAERSYKLPNPFYFTK